MDHLADIGSARPGAGQDLGEPCEHATAWIVRRGKHLGIGQPPRRKVKQHEVSEGAPDIDADAQAHGV